jgi:CRISPR-associated protein Cas4
MASLPILTRPAVLSNSTPSGSAASGVPDYLPARMVNEFVYCPRLFFYEWTQGLFRESADTVEGKIQHRRADAGPSKTPKAEDEAAIETIHSRSLTLSSERLRVIAKLDLLEGECGVFTPVDYKHGKPRDTEEGLELWPSDRVQLTIQGILLRENGYRCDEGVVYYQATKQRVRVVFERPSLAKPKRRSAQRGGPVPRHRFRLRWKIHPSARDVPWWGSACRTRRGFFRSGTSIPSGCKWNSSTKIFLRGCR